MDGWVVEGDGEAITQLFFTDEVFRVITLSPDGLYPPLSTYDPENPTLFT